MATFGGELGLQQARLEFAKRVHERSGGLRPYPSMYKDQAATEIALTEYLIKKAREQRTMAGLEVKKLRLCSIGVPSKVPFPGLWWSVMSPPANMSTTSR